jgi:hypothetical protein
MRKYLTTTLAVASALALSGAANAAVTVDGTSIENVDIADLDGTTAISYSEAGLARDSFSEFLTFSNSIAGLYSITLDTSSANVDFTSAVLTGAEGPFTLTKGFDNGTAEFWEKSNFLLGSGQYTLTINGQNSGTGSLAGTITIGQAVPEPATWAMMLFGFGAIGFAMRRRKDTAVTKRLRLSYS